MSTYFELSRPDTKIHCYNKTGYQSCGVRFRFFPHNTWDNQFSLVHHFPEPPSPNRPPRHPQSDLVPEFDLSIPTTSDDLGGFVRMPQGAYAHLVMSLDPVVKLGGLPIPDVQLSVRISWHHITGRWSGKKTEGEGGNINTLTSVSISPAKRYEFESFGVF